MQRFGEMKPLKPFMQHIGWSDSLGEALSATLKITADEVARTSRVMGIDYDVRGKVSRIETREAIYVRR